MNVLNNIFNNAIRNSMGTDVLDRDICTEVNEVVDLNLQTSYEFQYGCDIYLGQYEDKTFALMNHASFSPDHDRLASMGGAVADHNGNIGRIHLVEGLVNRLSNKELAALIMHEVGHIVFDEQALIDSYAGEEEGFINLDEIRADSLAIKEVGGKHMYSALQKVGDNLASVTGSRPWIVKAIIMGAQPIRIAKLLLNK